MRRFVFLLQFVLYGVIFANAQKLIVNVPSQVAVGENFRLTYTVNTQNAKDFHIGNIPDALEVITGPFKSVQASYRMVNGHTTGASSITFTFILCASKKGSYTISPAQITANGKRVSSSSARVKVSGESGVRTMLYLLAIVSVSISVANILPIPTFDGGQILICIAEMIRHGGLKAKTYVHLQLIGMLLALLIMAGMYYFDIKEYFF